MDLLDPCDGVAVTAGQIQVVRLSERLIGREGHRGRLAARGCRPIQGRHESSPEFVLQAQQVRKPIGEAFL